MTAPVTDLATVLAAGEMAVRGRFADASNSTLLVTCRDGEATVTGVFKPVAGMRPLHDFEASTLPAREVAAFELSAGAGWDCVPLTVWRESSQFGAGSVQEFIEQDGPADVVDVVPLPEAGAGVLTAFVGEDEEGEEVALVHQDLPGLRRLALFDAVTNNADRKAGHILQSRGALLGIDNGLTFHIDDKLRTVLWGWAGSQLEAPERELLSRSRDFVRDSDGSERLGRLLAPQEVQALQSRIESLLEAGHLPHPDMLRRCIPWPVF